MGSKEKKGSNKGVSSIMVRMAAVSMIVLIIVFGIASLLIARVKTETDSQVTMHNAGTVISGIVSDYMSGKISDVTVLASDNEVIDYALSIGDYETGEEALSAEGTQAVQEKLNRLVISSADIISAWVIARFVISR